MHDIEARFVSPEPLPSLNTGNTGGNEQDHFESRMDKRQNSITRPERLTPSQT